MICGLFIQIHSFENGLFFHITLKKNFLLASQDLEKLLGRIFARHLNMISPPLLSEIPSDLPL
jgi:hypothetical protein